MNRTPPKNKTKQEPFTDHFDDARRSILERGNLQFKVYIWPRGNDETEYEGAPVGKEMRFGRESHIKLISKGFSSLFFP